METGKKSKAALWIALAIVVVLTSIALMALSPIDDLPKRMDRTQVDMREVAYLTDIDMHVFPAEGRILIVGSVKNMTSKPLRFIKVMSTAQDKNAIEIGSGWGMIYLLEPGQTIPISYNIECDASNMRGVKSIVKSVWQ